jgi:hypothetical protein
LLDDGSGVTGHNLGGNVVFRSPSIDSAGEEVAKSDPILHQNDETGDIGGESKVMKKESK